MERRAGREHKGVMMPELLRAAQMAAMTPGAPVLDDAAVVVEDGAILAVGAYADMLLSMMWPR